MADFTNTVDILTKEVEQDTYILVPLQKTQDDKIVISESFNSNLQMIISSMPEINHNENKNILTEAVLNIISHFNFHDKLSAMVNSCFENIALSNIFNTDYTNNMLVSKNNLLQLAKYIIMTYTHESQSEIDTIFQPHGFLSILEVSNEMIKIKKNKFDQWETTKFYMIYNVCRNNIIEKKNICTNMINMIVDSAMYGEYPLFLFVNKENEAAKKCYTKNKFQVVKDVFSGLPNRPSEIKQEDENSIYMCHNKYDLKIIDGNDEYELMPNDAYRIALVAHGAIQAQQKNIFMPDFSVDSLYEKYFFPFKNMQYYVQKGEGLYMNPELPEQTGIYDVCYETILPNQNEFDVPINGTISTLPMLFQGLQKNDPKERADFIGLYDCNQKKRLEFNNELFGATNEKIVLLDDLLLKIYIYCIKNEIDPAIVEVKVFTCRAFCPTGDFPVMRDAHRRIDSNIQEGGETIENTQEKDVHYEHVGKLQLFDYIKEHSANCELPKKGGNKRKLTKKRRYKRKKKTLKRVI